MRGLNKRQLSRPLAAFLSAGLLCTSAACSVTTAPASPADQQQVAHAIGHTGGDVILHLGMPSPTPTLRGPKNWPRPWDHLDDPCAAPPVIAHRGEGGIVAPLPENTSAAELSAVAQGASMLNADVRWTKDDVPVAIHDAALDRTTTGTGPVLSITAAQFTALGLKSNDGKRRLPRNQHPQTLAQLLAAVKHTGVPIVLQMEADPFAVGGAGQASIDVLAAVIAASGYAAHVVVGGWEADDVSAFSTAAPDVMTAYIQESGNPSPASIIKTGARILYIDFARITRAQVVAWRAAGLAVWVWTPPFSAQWVKLREMGVDAIATNWVPAYTHWAPPCAAVPFS
ncbi:MAG TPA: glycerophosphodiester phosphodiesterase family protein [Actinocrinis sp.]|nr:glycerophosphodiester phosphodiesterase family protein [Actinocrinis sp.]